MTSLVDQNVLSRECVLAGQLEASHVQYVPHHPAFDVDVQLGVGVEAAGHVRREGGNEHTLSHKGLCVCMRMHKTFILRIWAKVYVLTKVRRQF